MWEVRGLQRPAPYVKENLRHWGHEGDIKGDTPGRRAGGGKETQITRTQSVEVLRSKLLAVPVETRWCIGAVH